MKARSVVVEFQALQFGVKGQRWEVEENNLVTEYYGHNGVQVDELREVGFR